MDSLRSLEGPEPASVCTLPFARIMRIKCLVETRMLSAPSIATPTGIKNGRFEWVVAVNRAATTESNRSFAGNRRHSALAAVTPHFPQAVRCDLHYNYVAEAILCYAPWAAEAGCQRIRIVLRGAVHVADTPRAGERGHGLVGVDHANTVVVLAANDDEVLPVFDNRGDAVRIVELRFEWVGVVRVAKTPVASEGTHRPVAKNGANAVIEVVAQQRVAFAVTADGTGIIESGSERVIAVHVRAAITTSSKRADGAVVIDDTQTVLSISHNYDAVWRVQGQSNGIVDCG